MNELTQLADKYQTDKGTQFFCAHNYTSHYHRTFQSLREASLTMVEIGLNARDRNDCPSLRMWLDYFPKAHIYGLDIRQFDFSHERATLLQCDQGDIESLQRVKGSIPNQVDIIIDDGSHIQEHQHVSFDQFFPILAPGGCYVVEDLTSPLARGSWKFFQALKEGNIGRAATLSCLEEGAIEKLHAQIDSIELCNSANSLYGAGSIAFITKAR